MPGRWSRTRGGGPAAAFAAGPRLCALAILAGTALLAGDAEKKSDTAKVATLEDFYGDTGTRFQAALSFYNREPFGSTITPSVSGYGIGVDDMFISWKESRLDEDTTVCAGECADLEAKSTLAYDATGFVELTVTDKTPYDALNPKNDCNGNGSYADAVDDQDCNNNGTTDVVVKLTSLEEVTGELAVLDRTAPTSPLYRGRLPYSALSNSPGSIFVQVNGTQNPEVTATYEDRNDGTGARCANALEPSQRGFLLARTTIVVSAGRIDFRGFNVTLAPGSPGDNDGFVDAGETVDMTVRFTNNSGLDLDDLVVGLLTTDPKIECISVPIVEAGSVLKGAVFTTPPFRFKVATAPIVERTSVTEILRATFRVTIRSNKFDVLTRVTEFFVDLDLNVAGGTTPPTSPFIESFEGVGLGKFTLMTLDAGKNSLALSDGYRCQYNDPFGVNSNAPGRADCFLGFPADPAAGVNDWHIQRADPANCNSGRAFRGLQSLRWGTCPPTATTPRRDTTRMRQLDAVRTIDPINIPAASTGPELTFKHQVSLVDNRNIVAIPAFQTCDRGVVQVQVADLGGNPIGNWVKISAYENAYDQQGTDNFANCTFDPVDDGNDEDDFFDPADPFRRSGPSSTCFPEFSYARGGHTDWRLDFNVNNVGLAVPGPGLQGELDTGFRNPGTWVQPRFDLSAYAAQRIRLRFLATTIELSATQLWDGLFAVDNVVGDDGWFIDDVQIMEALEAPMILEVDTASFAGLACPACTLATAVLSASPPPPLSGPGQIVTLEASGSSLNACNDGNVQYQFWIDGNLNGVVGDAGDTLLRDWTDGSTFLDAPQLTTRYGVRVRCSTATSCSGSAVLNVGVNCPSTGNAKAEFGQAIHVGKASLAGVEPDPAVTVNWPVTANVDLVRGNLIALRAASGNYTGTVSTCLGNNVNANAVVDGTNPGAGGATYFLVRPTVAPFCNQTPGYTTNHPKEAAGRDAEIAASGNACP
jgi:hypothetical protein